MAKTIANLAVSLTANTSKFSTGMSKAQRDLKAFHRTTQAVQSAIAGMAMRSAAAIASYFAISKSIRAITEAFKDLSTLSDQSAMLGETAQNMRRIQYAAKLAGVEIDSMNMALVRQKRFISMVKTGETEQSELFGRLGLDAQALAGKGPVDQFLAIARAIERIPNEVDKTRAAMEIWGRGSAPILTMISGGTDDIVRTMREADRTLGMLSDEQVNAADAVADKWDVLKMQGKQFFIGIAVSATKSLDAVSQGMIDVASNAMTMGETVGDAFVKMTTAIFEFTKSIRYTQVGILKMMSALLQVGRFISTLPGMSHLGPPTETWDKAIKAHEDAIQNIWEIRNLAKQPRTQLVMPPLKPKKTPMGDLEENADAFGSLDTIKKIASEADQLTRRYSPWEKYADDLSDLNSMLNQGLISLDTYQQAVADLGDAIDRVSGFDKMRDAAQKLTEGVMTPFEKMRKQQADVEELFSAGLITGETRWRAMADAERDYWDQMRRGVEDQDRRERREPTGTAAVGYNLATKPVSPPWGGAFAGPGVTPGENKICVFLERILLRLGRGVPAMAV
jgi:hypothetical protein